jgi:hypothetical protein
MYLEASNLKVRVGANSIGELFPSINLEASNLKVAAAPRVY